MSDEEIREMVRRSRAEQGFPPTVEDPVALAKIRAIITGSLPPCQHHWHQGRCTICGRRCLHMFIGHQWATGCLRCGWIPED